MIDGLGLTDLQLWWDAEASGTYQAVGGEKKAFVAPPGYLDALSRPGEPLVSADPAQHPWREEGRVTGSRVDVGLRDDRRRGGPLVGLLWLMREPGMPWPRADLSRAGRLAALLERLLAGCGWLATA